MTVFVTDSSGSGIINQAAATPPARNGRASFCRWDLDSDNRTFSEVSREAKAGLSIGSRASWREAATY
jgi:hypothetical protein